MAGQALVPVIVSKQEGILDLERFNRHHGQGTDALDTSGPVRVLPQQYGAAPVDELMDAGASPSA